jgi:hypothetical protein
MPVTVRNYRSEAALVMVAKWCLARGEKVTLAMATRAAAERVRSSFSEEELQKIAFSIVGDAPAAA